MPRTAKARDHQPAATPATPTARTNARTPRATKKTALAPSGRLRPGQLQSLVLDHLKRHPDRDWNAGDVAKALNRSSGAVGNALETFATRGLLTRTSTSPRRYQAIKTTRGSISRAGDSDGAATKPSRTKPPRTEDGAPDATTSAPGGRANTPRAKTSRAKAPRAEAPATAGSQARGSRASSTQSTSSGGGGGDADSAMALRAAAR